MKNYDDFLQFAKNLTHRRGRLWLTIGDARFFRLKPEDYKKLLERAVADGFLSVELVNDKPRRQIIPRYYLTELFRHVKNRSKYNKIDDPREYLKRRFRRLTYNAAKPIVRTVGSFVGGPIKSRAEAQKHAAAIVKQRSVHGVHWVDRDKNKLVFNHVKE